MPAKRTSLLTLSMLLPLAAAYCQSRALGADRYEVISEHPCLGCSAFLKRRICQPGKAGLPEAESGRLFKEWTFFWLKCFDGKGQAWEIRDGIPK